MLIMIDGAMLSRYSRAKLIGDLLAKPGIPTISIASPTIVRTNSAAATLSVFIEIADCNELRFSGSAQFRWYCCTAERTSAVMDCNWTSSSASRNAEGGIEPGVRLAAFWTTLRAVFPAWVAMPSQADAQST